MDDEWIEALYDDGTSADRVLRREVHQRGLWHRTVHVWVVSTAVEGGALLFQRRALTKDVAPGMLDVTVGGHVAPGEDLRLAAARELHEELGATVSPDALTPVGLRQCTGMFGAVIDREMQTLFAIADGRELSDYRISDDEVLGLVALPVEDGLSLFAGTVDATDAPCYHPAGTGEQTRERVCRDDFVPSMDAYFYRALVMARRWLRGEDHLVV